MNIDISNPVSREEAIRIIETSLYLNGFSLVPSEGNIVKVVGAGKNPRNFGINIYSDVCQIPDDVSIVSVVFQLQYADSKDVKAVVDPYVSNSIYTSTVPLPGGVDRDGEHDHAAEHREDHRGGGCPAGGGCEPVLRAAAGQREGCAGQD